MKRYKSVDDYIEAATEWQDELRRLRKILTSTKLEETVKNLDDVVQTTLEITSDPPGADIFIDAEALGKIGQTPKTVTIEPGTHTVILRKQGYHVTTKTVAVKAREAHKAAVAMEVPLEVKSEPEGADVRVDSDTADPIGKTPYSGGIVPGKRTIFIAKEGYKTAKQEVDAAPGGNPIRHRCVRP